MNKLFRQVKSSERRPEKNDTYATSRGDCLYHVNLDGFVNDMGFRIMPEYWYEPVEIPGNKDVDIESVKFAKRCDPKNETLEKQADLIFGYKEGFKAAINHLTGGK